MACQCALDLQERIQKEDEHVQGFIEAVKIRGRDLLLQKEFNQDGIRQILIRAVVVLSETINRNKSKEKSQVSNIEVATSRTEKPKIDKEQIKKAESDEKSKNEMEEESGKKEICYAYRYDKCPYKNDDECPNRHPEKCQKFCNFGHKDIDKNGCETKDCDLLHPKLCRNSTKLKECPYRKCRFQHLIGTKIVPMRKFESVKTARENRSTEEKNSDKIIQKLDKLIDLISASFHIQNGKKNMSFSDP